MQPDSFVIPPGFRRFPAVGGFATHNGPLYVRRDGARICFAFQCLDRHLNSGGTCHGGWQMAVIDMALCTAASIAVGGKRYAITVAMNSEFLGPVKPGQWVEVWAEALKTTGKMGFADCRLTADGELAAHASATMKLLGESGAVDMNALFAD